MTDEEKLLWMFKEVHGDTGRCYPEVKEDYKGDPHKVNLMKDGEVCWSVSKADLMFDYLTKHL